MGMPLIVVELPLQEASRLLVEFGSPLLKVNTLDFRHGKSFVGFHDTAMTIALVSSAVNLNIDSRCRF